MQAPFSIANWFSPYADSYDPSPQSLFSKPKESESTNQQKQPTDKLDKQSVALALPSFFHHKQNTQSKHYVEGFGSDGRCIYRRTDEDLKYEFVV